MVKWNPANRYKQCALQTNRLRAAQIDKFNVLVFSYNLSSFFLLAGFQMLGAEGEGSSVDEEEFEII